MSSSPSLSKQKRRISILFSLSIFLIIVVLDIGFLSYKYLDYKRLELDRLSLQIQGIIRTIRENPSLEQDIVQEKGFLISAKIRRGGMMGQWGQRRGIQTENFFLYNRTDGKILFSPRQDDELYSFLLKEIQTRKWETIFKLGDSEYFFLDAPVTKDINAVFFTESRMTPESVLLDILIYLIGALLLSLGVYAISSRFVHDTLSPVEKNMEQMEQFIHNAGHELKTPIAVVKSSLELMKLKKNYDEGIAESIGELDKMDNLIQALISLSTTDDPNISGSIDIREICEKLRKNYSEKLKAKHISLEIIEKKPLFIQANREYAEIFLGNLLSNAIKYNREKGKIIITIEEKGVAIQDSGIGIAKENLGKIFDRFYREWEAREESSFGIGLSLVKKIADMYKWTIVVTSEKDIGTIVKVWF